VSPIKLGKTQTIRNKTTGKLEHHHDYVKLYSKSELIEMYNKQGTLPKRKQKIKNELVKRGGVVFNDDRSESEESLSDIL